MAIVARRSMTLVNHDSKFLTTTQDLSWPDARKVFGETVKRQRRYWRNGKKKHRPTTEVRTEGDRARKMELHLRPCW